VILQPGLDLQAYLFSKEQKLKKLGLTLQPHVVILCEDTDKLGSGPGGCVAYAVIQSNLVYEVPSVMAAVDICIKGCFVLNLHYCHGARSSWLYVQKAVYRITTARDQNTSQVLQLLADAKTD
jgi:hypothetical protein